MAGRAKLRLVASASNRGDDRDQSGTQSIERAIAILRALASTNNVGGARFADLAQITGLSSGTLYRILRTLRREGFVGQHPATRLYHLGMDFLSLGFVSTNRFNLREIAQPYLQSLANESQDTVYLAVRSGLEAVCIDRVEGMFPIKSITLNIGSRRPLGVGSLGLALLAWLPQTEIVDILNQNARRFATIPEFTTSYVLDMVQMSTRQGYTFNDGRYLHTMCGVGVPVLGKNGKPLAALSIAAIPERMSPLRRQELAAMLRHEAQGFAEVIMSRGAQPRSQ